MSSGSRGSGEHRISDGNRRSLPLLATGTRVEVRGIQHDGTITVERLRAKDAAAALTR